MSTLDEDDLGQAYDWRLLKRFFGYIARHWVPVTATVVIVLVSIAVELAAPFILRAALDGPVAQKDPLGLAQYAGWFMGVALFAGLSELIQQYVSNLAGQRIIFDLRNELFSHLQRLPATYYDRNPVGRLLTRVTSDVENLSELFTSGLIGMLGEILFLIAIVGAMFVVEARLALLTLISVPIVLVAASIFRHHARTTYRGARRAIAHANAYLNETLGGIKTIQAFGRQATCAERYAGRNADYREKSTRAAYIYSFFWPGIEMISTMMAAGMLWYAGRGILAGTMSFGTFIAFWYLMRKFFEPIQELAEKFNILQAAMASSERIFKLLDTPPAIVGPENPANPERRGEVEFQNVSFSYDGKTPILNKVSFHLKPGETVALVGYTGAGKSSILSLLLRLYDVDSGNILVDGVDVREHDPRELRARFGMVFQDVQLFSGTARDNIALGREVSQQRLERATELVNAGHVINRLPQGYQSQLHERGSALSAGERQLLSFARALVDDPPILVLDEATSAVDAETEGLIQDALDKALKGRSALIVAHRLSTIRRAQRILVLHHGSLREQGTHEELLAKGGLYEKLYRLQWQKH
jgi:ATP-binding cassette subfamily B multidrug efflux pump